MLKGSDRMKRALNSKIFLIVICGIIFTNLGIYASGLYSAKDVTYQNESSEINNVNDALDNLYNIKTELDNLKSLGNAEASDIATGTTAVVQGKLIEGIKKDKNLSIISAGHSAGNYTNLEPGTYALIITGTVQSNGRTRPNVSIGFNITGGELISKVEKGQNSDYGPDWYGFRDTVWLFTITDETNTVKTTVTYGTPNVGCFKAFSVLVGLK